MDEKNELNTQDQILAYLRTNVITPTLDIFRTSHHMTESVSIDHTGLIRRIHGRIGDREKILLSDGFVSLIFNIKAEEESLERNKAEASEHAVYRQILKAPDQHVHVRDLPGTKHGSHIIYYARQTDNKLRFFIHGRNMLVTSQLAVVAYDEKRIIKQSDQSGYMFIPDEWVNQLIRICEQQQLIEKLKNQFKQHQEYNSMLISTAGQTAPLINPRQNTKINGFNFLNLWENTNIQNARPTSDKEVLGHEQSAYTTYQSGKPFLGSRLTRQRSFSHIEHELSGGSPKSNQETFFDSGSTTKVDVQKETSDETQPTKFKV